MRRLLLGGIIALISLFSSDASACFYDSDCPKGADCVWLFGEREGMCEWGALPGEPNRQRAVDPQHGNTTEGKRCMYDYDCDEGMSCVPQENTDRRFCHR